MENKRVLYGGLLDPVICDTWQVYINVVDQISFEVLSGSTFAFMLIWIIKHFLIPTFRLVKDSIWAQIVLVH